MPFGAVLAEHTLEKDGSRIAKRHKRCKRSAKGSKTSFSSEAKERIEGIVTLSANSCANQHSWIQ